MGFVGDTTETQSGYDNNGSQTRKTTQAGESDTSKGMEWSFEGTLLRVEKGETNATKFTYDAGGNRIQTLTRDGATIAAANYLVDENTAYAQVLEKRDAAGELQARYVYGQGYGPILLQRVQKNAAGVEEVRARYLLADGHVRQLVTASGTVTDSYFYDAWGGALSGGSGNTVNPYRYNGQQTDEAMCGYYLRARYYQPGNGRFLGMILYWVTRVIQFRCIAIFMRVAVGLISAILLAWLKIHPTLMVGIESFLMLLFLPNLPRFQVFPTQLLPCGTYFSTVKGKICMLTVIIGVMTTMVEHTALCTK